MSGMKNDSGKPDLTLVSYELLVLLARVREFGNKKYEKNNWKKGFKVTRSLAAALRHIFQFLSGETLDRESGLSHLGHAVASIEHAIYDMEHKPENDDRTVETKQREQIPAKILFTKLPEGSSIDNEIAKLKENAQTQVMAGLANSGKVEIITRHLTTINAGSLIDAFRKSGAV